jgi:hypothetical protein
MTNKNDYCWNYFHDFSEDFDTIGKTNENLSIVKAKNDLLIYATLIHENQEYLWKVEFCYEKQKVPDISRHVFSCKKDDYFLLNLSKNNSRAMLCEQHIKPLNTENSDFIFIGVKPMEGLAFEKFIFSDDFILKDFQDKTFTIEAKLDLCYGCEINSNKPFRLEGRKEHVRKHYGRHPIDISIFKGKTYFLEEIPKELLSYTKGKTFSLKKNRNSNNFVLFDSKPTKYVNIEKPKPNQISKEFELKIEREKNYSPYQIYPMHQCYTRVSG